MVLRSRVWSAGKVLALVVALGATFLLSAFIAVRLAVRAREVTVPDLTKSTVNQASARLEELGLTLRVDENRRIDPAVPAGRILQQDPAPGTRVRRARSVRVWVSQGEPTIVVPSLVGQTERTAQMQLQQEGLAVAAVAEIRSHDYATEAVVAQDPAPNTRGDRVALLVNRGERAATYVMPDLIGADGERAAEFLRRRGFRVAVTGTQPYPGVPAGIVLRQTPQGGFQIAPGEAIALEVSR
ncbi:MAG TPA: PASTA domain-containing protein [Vicinamibacterales bacterium]